LPRSNGYGVVAGIYENLAVFGLATDNANGFFTYNPSTGSARSDAIVTITGYPYKFYQFR